MEPMLPNDFLLWKSVSDDFKPWKKSGLWPRGDEKLSQEVGEAGARHTEVRAGMIDSQTVKTTEQGIHYDAGQKYKGEKGPSSG